MKNYLYTYDQNGNVLFTEYKETRCINSEDFLQMIYMSGKRYETTHPDLFQDIIGGDNG